MNYILKDLIDIPKLQDLLDTLDEIHSLPSAIIDAEGNILTATAWQDICTKFHRANPETEKRCRESDSYIVKELDKNPSHVIYNCPFGLVDTATPIIVEGHHLGNVFTGQLFTEPPDEERFIRQAQQYGFDETDYLEALRKVPMISEKRLRKNLNFLGRFAEMLATQGLVHKRQLEIEKALRKNEVNLKKAEKIAKIGNWDWNIITNELVWSDEVYRLYGIDPLREKPSYDVIVKTLAPECRDRFSAAIGDALQHDKPFDGEYRMISLDGTVHYTHTTGEVIRDHEGRPLSMFGIVQDITERKQSEKTMWETYNLLNSISEGSSDAIYVKDIQGRYLLFNKEAARVTGKKREEVIGKDDYFLFPADEAEIVMDGDRKVMECGQTMTYEEVVTTADGIINYLSTKGPLYDNKGKVIGLFGIARNITERKRAEEEIQLSRQWLSLHVQWTPLAVVEFDLEGRMLGWNPAAEKIFGFSREEAIGQHWHFMVPQSVWGSLDGVWEGLITQRGGSRSTNKNVTKDGRIINCEWFNTPLIDPNGKTIGVASLVMDVTERMQAEEKLADRNRFIESIINLTPDILYIHDIVDMKNVYSNDGIIKILGYTTPEIKEMGDQLLPLLMHPDDLQTYFRETMPRYAKAKDNEPIIHEYRMKHKNGEWRWLYSNELIYTRERDRSPRQIFGLIHDITESKHAEEQMQRSISEKEVMLKEIHHRVKNNMQVICSLLSLQAKGVADSTVQAILEESRNRVNSMSLVHEKLYQSKDLAHIDFKEYLQSLVAGIADTYKKHGVVISVDMGPVALDVNVGIPCGLIVNELVSNSLKHAFPDGRKGTISLGINKNSEGGYVLFVAENGIGFPAEVDFRKPSTLGLQLVNVLSGQINGKIELMREEGTRFSITFPGTSKK